MQKSASIPADNEPSKGIFLYLLIPRFWKVNILSKVPYLHAWYEVTADQLLRCVSQVVTEFRISISGPAADRAGCSH